MHGTNGNGPLQFWTRLLITRRCEKCSQTMRLTLVAPGKPGQDIRTFECTGCDNKEDHVVDWY
jgi:hypothetical protein